MKRTIKLTENDLHRVIKESVNTILSELDWRTYQSAYEKALKRGDWKKANEFRQAATNSFNRQNGYGLKNVPYGNGSDENARPDGQFYAGGNTYEPYGDTFGTVSAKATYGQDKPEAVYNTQNIRTNDGWRGDGKRGDAYPQEQESEYPQKNSFNPSLKYKQMKGDKQVRDYFNGKSKYVKGKGWN